MKHDHRAQERWSEQARLYLMALGHEKPGRDWPRVYPCGCTFWFDRGEPCVQHRAAIGECPRCVDCSGLTLSEERTGE